MDIAVEASAGREDDLGRSSRREGHAARQAALLARGDGRDAQGIDRAGPSGARGREDERSFELPDGSGLVDLGRERSVDEETQRAAVVLDLDHRPALGLERPGRSVDRYAAAAPHVAALVAHLGRDPGAHAARRVRLEAERFAEGEDRASALADLSVRTQRAAQHEAVAQVPRRIGLHRDLDLRARRFADERERLALEAVVDDAASEHRAFDPERTADRLAFEVPGADHEHAFDAQVAGLRVDPHARGGRAGDGEVVRRPKRVLHERDADAVSEVELREHPDPDAEDQRHEGHDEEELDQRERSGRPLPHSPDRHASHFPS